MGALSLLGRLGGAALKRPGATLGGIDNVLTIGGIGLASTSLPGMSDRTNRDAAKDFDIKDLDGAYDSLGWHQKLPFIGATKEGLEKQIRKQETQEFKDSDVYKLGIAGLDADQIPDITGMDKDQAAVALGTATRQARKTRDNEDWTTKLERTQQAAVAEYNMPHLVEERRREQQRYNDTLLREAQIRADAINARQEGNMLQLQLAEMADRRDHRKDKANARMQMVAALTSSLGGLGDAFLSI